MSNNILVTMEDLSKTIGAVLEMEGLGGIETRVVQGPMTLTFQFRLNPVTKEGVSFCKSPHFGKLLEQMSGIGPVRVSSPPGCFIVEFPSPETYTPGIEILTEHTLGANLCIGIDHVNEPVYYNIKRSTNLMLIGPPQHGKTSAMRTILYQCIREGSVNFIIIAERMISWEVFKPLSGCVGVYGKAEVGLQVLTQLAEVMEEKANRQEKFIPSILVVLDDLMSLLSASPGLVEKIERLSSAGGQVGIYLMMGTQSAGSKGGSGGMRIEDLFNTRITYRTSGAQASYRVTGRGGEEVDQLTNTPGDALFINGNERVRVATGIVTDEVIKALKDLPPTQLRFSPVLTQVPVEERKSVVTQVREVQKSIELPRIKPARVPTEEEVAQIVAYLATHKMSSNEVQVAVFGGKGGGNRAKLVAGFGDLYEKYFPLKRELVNDTSIDG